MKIKSFMASLTLFVVLSALTVYSQESNIDPMLAQQYFQEAERISQKDNGELWGVELYGPMLFADRNSREAVANRADDLGILKPNGDVFSGQLPDEINISNTALKWAGKHWTMVAWPLPEDPVRRANLIAHELFHRIQHKVGFPANNPANAHLEKMPARILLLLEWQALKTALNHSGRQRQADVESALIFRNRRWELFPDAAKEEVELELNEGVCEYTGVKLSGRSRQEIIAHLSEKIDNAQSLKSLTRSFAYTSGPVYGMLLDEGNDIKWRKTLKSQNDFGKLLQTAYEIDLPEDLQAEAEKRAAKYNGEAITKSEQQREADRQAKIKALYQKFVRGPVVKIPLQMMNFSFNPNNVQPLDSLGTYYPNMRLTDTWGILTVENGALMASTWNRVTLSAAALSPAVSEKSIIEGDGWKLELTEDWRLAPVAGTGNYLLKRTP